MATVVRSLRRNLLAPSLHAVGFKGRGFRVAPSPATRQLEVVPQSVVCGFEWGMESRDLWELERRLGMIDPEVRGFAYEGATMALTILDATGFRRYGRTRELLLNFGEPHIFLAYIGIGFAMARLPRVLWKKVLPDLRGSAYHPTMSWLAVDGYGFDLAYFDTKRWVDERTVPRPYPWDGAEDYFPRAVDQGIGRALWFIHGAEVDRVAEAVRGFAEHRHADLWSGVGLAATFAGGCIPADLARLRERADVHGPDLAVGTVFAAKARDYASFVPTHTEAAVAVFTGETVSDVVRIADSTAVHKPGPDSTPSYELWRRRIRECYGPAHYSEMLSSSNDEES